MTQVKRRRALAFLALFGIATAVPQMAYAADAAYPDKPIRLIIPFGAGGITDVAGRLIGQYLGEALSQQIVIENRPGAGGSIAAQAITSAPPTATRCCWAPWAPRS
ncbi:hypothetical protein [Acidovorax sp. SDU_ACID1]|uniref:hypothetical protein n=1 Tax=Acidovorax sp. SDU_ACID1 TaxID=3136632 RepID=UPI003872F7B0